MPLGPLADEVLRRARVVFRGVDVNCPYGVPLVPIPELKAWQERLLAGSDDPAQDLGDSTGVSGARSYLCRRRR